MNKYGEVAVRAVHLFKDEKAESPRAAWSMAAADIFGEGTSSQEKACPQNAFLGLCEEGLVKGFPSGTYTRSRKNKKYALEAVKILKRHPDWSTDRKRLWRAVMRGEQKKHNSQMDVVVALWNAGLIVGGR
jgi:hypothetical protein